MSRWVLAAYGGLVQGATFGIVIGFTAAILFSKLPGGTREGANAMAGIFFVGPIAATIGLTLGGWGVWRILAQPERAGAVAIWLTVQLLALAIGVAFTLRPTGGGPDDYPDHTAELHVEMRFPEAHLAALDPAKRLYFEMRSADGEEVATVFLDRVRREQGGAIVPGVFVTKTTPRSKLLAVMAADRQLMCSTLNLEGQTFEDTTDWSAWQEMEESFQVRWRFVLKRRSTR